MHTDDEIQEIVRDIAKIFNNACPTHLYSPVVILDGICLFLCVYLTRMAHEIEETPEFMLEKFIAGLKRNYESITEQMTDILRARNEKH